jgi:hypothetical protein
MAQVSTLREQLSTKTEAERELKKKLAQAEVIALDARREVAAATARLVSCGLGGARTRSVPWRAGSG